MLNFWWIRYAQRCLGDKLFTVHFFFFISLLFFGGQLGDKLVCAALPKLQIFFHVYFFVGSWGLPGCYNSV